MERQRTSAYPRKNIDSDQECLDYFQSCDSIPLRKYPELLRVYEASRKALDALRITHHSHPRPWKESEIHLIQKEDWDAQPGGSQDNIGSCIYPHCFVCFDEEKYLHSFTQRADIAHTILHEMMHRMSGDGLLEYSEPLDEGFTEFLSRPIFRSTIRSLVLNKRQIKKSKRQTKRRSDAIAADNKEEMYFPYEWEHETVRMISETRQDLFLKLKDAYIKGDADFAEYAIRKACGNEAADYLSRKHYSMPALEALLGQAKQE